MIDFDRLRATSYGFNLLLKLEYFPRIKGMLAFSEQQIMKDHLKQKKVGILSALQ